MHDEEASAEHLIHVALQIARRSVTGDTSPQPEKEEAGEDSHQARAMARVIELAGGGNGIEGDDLSSR